MMDNSLNNHNTAVILENNRLFTENNFKEFKDGGTGNPDDTTPSDSGVQLLDSESSELMIESITSLSNFDLDEYSKIDCVKTESNENVATTEIVPYDKVEVVVGTEKYEEAINEGMNESICSTFDTENIVYRRRVKKQYSANKTQKKRVSFHEDILKNTRTDNIHIEHGFITYKSARAGAGANVGVGRYSWCPQGDSEQLYNNKPENSNSGHVYRNACSDVLEYGNTDLYDSSDNNLKYSKEEGACMCSSSSSNSSFDSNDSDNNSNNQDGYLQGKSNSCDCIGQNIINNNVIGEKSYFSEPNLDNCKKPKKSVWNKERKPKSSCLKKSGRSGIILEQDLNSRVKKFNVHDMNNIINNGKMIFGSLKSIFANPLPERGVPEGSEDVQSVCECVPENEGYKEHVNSRGKPFLSKSLDGSKEKKSRRQFIHNVDEQLRRAPESDDVDKNMKSHEDSTTESSNELVLNDFDKSTTVDSKAFRSKFIVNCESTVFEHVGVSYSYEDDKGLSGNNNLNSVDQQFAGNKNNTTSLATAPLKQTFMNILNKFKESSVAPPETIPLTTDLNKSPTEEYQEISVPTVPKTYSKYTFKPTRVSSPIPKGSGYQKHLASPIRKLSTNSTISGRALFESRRSDHRSFTPDLFNTFSEVERSSKTTSLTDDFEDILTITTDTDQTENDISMTSRSETGQPSIDIDFSRQPKETLIKRFLRNIAQKKALELPISHNEFFSMKLKNEKKVFSGDLYSKDLKLQNYELIQNLNAELALEMEMSTWNSPQFDVHLGDLSKFDPGIGEIYVDIFKSEALRRLMLPKNEQLMKAFKLYTGYSREGHMTPVLVLLTNQSLYVVGYERNQLCNKFVLSYSELDVILMGLYGNTVLLCNSDRNMQQVLLAGGPYPADGLVANLELCARKGGFVLPAVGELTLEHLIPLQRFVRQSSVISETDNWLYYAIVNVPYAFLSRTSAKDSIIKGFLMYRRLLEQVSNGRKSWLPGYFVLKSGVIYMFADSESTQPTIAIALAECQGARRTLNPSRPHCFEVVLKHEILQLAAPDEYVASEWLQALVQSAAVVFEQQPKHYTLGCTLVMTQNSIITLREDFRAPMSKLDKPNTSASIQNKLSSSESISFPRELDNFVTKSPKSTSQNLSPNKTPNVEEKKKKSYFSSMYGSSTSEVQILTSAAIKEIIGIRISAHSESWWCILEFACQEMGENTDDLIVLFASSSEMQRFLRMLEHIWQSINNDLFPIIVLDEDDVISKECIALCLGINRSWDELLSAVLGYPPLDIN